MLQCGAASLMYIGRRSQLRAEQHAIKIAMTRSAGCPIGSIRRERSSASGRADAISGNTTLLSILNGSFTKQAHKTQRLEACKSETLMTDAELLQHYIQCNRIIHGAQRCPGHHRLLKLGFIAEHRQYQKPHDHRDSHRPHCN